MKSGQRVGIMARAPLPGACKTRLARSLGASKAAELYRAMLFDTLEGYSRLPFTSRVLFAAPENDGVAALGAVAPRGWTVVPQQGTELGARLVHARRELGEGRAILVSSDSPTAPFDAIGQALAEWGDPNQALLGACTDGGYYLIGVASSDPRAFQDIPWSTDRVAASTRVRLAELGLSVRELPARCDVDEVPDLDELSRELAQDPHLAPLTRVVLEAR
jgi:rSAM/selenodomain-associated transferase 1